jgi:hypothetical protein
MKESEESKFKAEIDAIEGRIKTILKNIEKVAPVTEEKEPPAAEVDQSGDNEPEAEKKES